MIELMNLLSMTFVLLAVPPLLLRLVPKPAARHDTSPLPKDDRGRVVFFDMARGVAILAVILIHVIYLYDASVARVSETALDVMNNSLRFAIAVFFIASGALLTAPTWTVSSVAAFYRDKVIRLGLPYLLTVAVLSIVAGDSWSTFARNLITGDAAVPFYFIVVLFQLYLLYPLLQPLARQRIFVFMTLVFVIITALFPVFWSWQDIPLFFRYVFFFVWGIYMREQLLTGTVTREWWPWLTIVALYFGMPILIGIDNFYNMQPYYGVAIMMLLYLLSVRRIVSGALESSLAWVGRLSLWIFLTHFTLLAWLLPALADFEFVTRWWLLFVGSINAVVLSLVLAYVCAIMYERVTRFLVRMVRRVPNTYDA